MTRPETLLRRLASALMRHAMHLLPGTRAEWAKAMLAEMHHLNSDREAFVWAFGCVITGIKERIRAMTTGSLPISRWVLLAWMLLCFVPINIGWYDTLFGVSGIFSPGAGIYFDLLTKDGLNNSAVFFLFCVFVIGPLEFIGLLAALRLAMLDRPLRSRSLGIALITVPAFICTVTLLGRLQTMGLHAFSLEPFDAVNFWQTTVLLWILPAAGAASLFYLSNVLKQRTSFA